MREGMKTKPQTGSCYQRCGLWGSSDGKWATRRVWQGEDFLLADRFFPSAKTAPSLPVATSRRRWTSLSASMCAKNRSVASYIEQRFECRPEPGCAGSIAWHPTASWAGRQTPVERGALACSPKTGAVKLPSAKQEPRHGCPGCPKIGQRCVIIKPK